MANDNLLPRNVSFTITHGKNNAVLKAAIVSQIRVSKVPGKMHNKLKLCAAHKGITINKFIKDIMKEAIMSHPIETTVNEIHKDASIHILNFQSLRSFDNLAIQMGVSRQSLIKVLTYQSLQKQKSRY